MQAATLFAVRRALRPDPVQVASLWARFVATRDPKVREELVGAYMEFARMLAAKVYARRVYTEMEFGDYLQYATVGLMESIDRFEPERGFLFETYAGTRVTGAILSGIECSSEIQAQIVARKRIVATRVASLAAPAVDHTGTASDDVFSRLAEIAIGLAVGFALEDSGMYQGEQGEYGDNSYTGVEMKQLQSRLMLAVGELPVKQRHVIQEHYVNHISFEQIATGMALTRGRIAQIHKQGLAGLKAALQQSGGVDLLF